MPGHRAPCQHSNRTAFLPLDLTSVLPDQLHITMNSDEPPSFSSDHSDESSQDSSGQSSTCPAISGQCKALSREISWKLGDQPSRRPHNSYQRVEQTSTPNTHITLLTHLFSELAVPSSVERPPEPGNQQGRRADRQADRQAEGEGEEGGEEEQRECEGTSL